MSHVQLFAFLLFASQIILNGSSVIPESSESVSSEEETHSPTLPEGYVTFSDIHTSYKIHRENATTWNEARKRCVAEGAHLAIPDSSEKMAHLSSLKVNWGEYDWLHTGIYHSNITNEWVRVDNDLPVAFVPWAEENPDNTGNCTGVSIDEIGLVDYGCDTAIEFYACEIPNKEN